MVICSHVSTIWVIPYFSFSSCSCDTFELPNRLVTSHFRQQSTSLSMPLSSFLILPSWMRAYLYIKIYSLNSIGLRSFQTCPSVQVRLTLTSFQRPSSLIEPTTAMDSPSLVSNGTWKRTLNFYPLWGLFAEFLIRALKFCSLAKSVF